MKYVTEKDGVKYGKVDTRGSEEFTQNLLEDTKVTLGDMYDDCIMVTPNGKKIFKDDLMRDYTQAEKEAWAKSIVDHAK